nr:hypothetical protein [Tanacetum cinerariifolium]GFA60014.1 hypothetical protein [Tanacetum cinerariifolium]
MFDKAFEDFRSELVECKEKRAGEELIEERAKKQKVEDDKETAKLKQLMEIILDKEEVAINAITLVVKSPRIVDWKIHKERKKIYYQIMRADRKTQMYMVFSKMLKCFYRDDLEDLYKLIYILVEKKYLFTPPTLTTMLEKKLQIDYQSEMAYQLLKLIMKQIKKIVAAQVYVNIAQLELVLLVNLNEKYTKCLLLLVEVKTVDTKVNAASRS